MNKAKELLQTIVEAIVNRPESVSVEAITDELGVLLTLHVHKEDMGLVIGRAGSTAKSIRNIIRSVGMKEQARINIKIAEPENE